MGARILVTGANGFIGASLVARLLKDGHEITAVVRRPESMQQRFPDITVVQGDMNLDTGEEAWAPRLAGVDAVINCAGVLQDRHGQSLWAIHRDSPIALFKACKRLGIRRVVQISAVSIGADTDYARSKLAADDYLTATEMDWVVLRPSLVYGSGSYGGTSLMRALAVCPFLVPLIGKGDQVFTPIHVDDLCDCVAAAVAEPGYARQVLEPCGPETMTMRDILGHMRQWLGFAPVPFFSVPRRLVGLLAKVGDRIGTGALTTTSLKQLDFGNAADPQAYQEATGLQPRRFADALSASPAQVQDRWHARFTLLRPLVWLSLIVLWACSGLLGLMAPVSDFAPLLNGLGLTEAGAAWAARGFGIFDLILAAAILLHFRPKLTGLVQLVLVGGYTIGLTSLSPDLWAEPLGPLLKNIPILALVLVWMVLEDER
ncbi:NAD(P)H-binding protein [Aestuariispira ectoiniformans]|uniref:NAD(P)H-binding protein n=1 Tax=Aestuariispira ectoiniformans TaxID=2775080 RepID=UPI00223BF6E8|nr:NAD(P)H-binding protein [Aestuariispira ectoiniformans]